MAGVSGKKRVEFRVVAEPGSEVYVAGSFNAWKAGDKVLSDRQGEGVYRRVVYLPAGRHEYKFIINDQWSVDPECPEWTMNNFGTLNSVRIVD